MNNIDFYTVDPLYLLQKTILNPEAPKGAKDRAIKRLYDMANRGNGQAMYIVAKFILDGVIIPDGDPQEIAIKYMKMAAQGGSRMARAYLNSLDQKSTTANLLDSVNQALKSNQQHTIGVVKEPTHPGMLVDFHNNMIEIDKTGIQTPVDVTLDFVDGKNILKISTNIDIHCYNEQIDEEKVFEAIKNGAKLWEGDYKVFGNQEVSVKVDVTNIQRDFDNLDVYIADKMFLEKIKQEGSIGALRYEDTARSIDQGSSFHISVGEWTAETERLIVLISQTELFTDYDHLANVFKHEFGHALGLGDLYRYELGGLKGVRPGKFDDLERYRVSGYHYNLVMCDADAPVVDNDIEMVILAFMQNRKQDFQTSAFGGEVSEALGQGN